MVQELRYVSTNQKAPYTHNSGGTPRVLLGPSRSPWLPLAIPLQQCHLKLAKLAILPVQCHKNQVFIKFSAPEQVFRAGTS